MTDLPLFTNTRINQQVPIDSSYLTFTNSTIPGMALVSVPASIITGTIPASQITGTLVLLNTLTASNSATLDDTTHITSAYDEYMIVLRNVVPASANVGLKMRISTDGGGTWKTSGYLSIISGGFATGTGGSGSANEAVTDGILLSSNSNAEFDGQGTTAGFGVSGTVFFHAPNNTAALSHVTGTTTWLASGSVRLNVGSLAGAWNGTGNAINAIRFLEGSGNITSGTIKIYGVGT